MKLKAGGGSSHYEKLKADVEKLKAEKKAEMALEALIEDALSSPSAASLEALVKGAQNQVETLGIVHGTVTGTGVTLPEATIDPNMIIFKPNQLPVEASDLLKVIMNAGKPKGADAELVKQNQDMEKRLKQARRALARITTVIDQALGYPPADAMDPDEVALEGRASGAASAVLTLLSAYAGIYTRAGHFEAALGLYADPENWDCGVFLPTIEGESAEGVLAAETLANYKPNPEKLPTKAKAKAKKAKKATTPDPDGFHGDPF
jgi:hypothetical protein